MANSRALADELGELFGSRLFTTAQAAAAGVAERRVQRAAAAGTVQRAAKGCFYLGDAEDGYLRYCRRCDAALRGRPDAVLIAVSAAARWGLPCPDPWGDWGRMPICLASPAPIHGVPGLIRCGLGGRDARRVDGAPVTDLATTASDSARLLPAPQALIIVDAAARRMAGTSDRALLSGERARLMARSRLQLALEATSGPHTAIARTILGWADPAAESAPESYLRAHIRMAGLLVPLVNPQVVGASGKRYWVDLFWPESALGIEVDGRVKYTDGGVHYREKLRHDDLRAAGVLLHRWTAEEIFANAELLVLALR